MNDQRPKLAGVIFDMDGVLCDTEEQIAAAAAAMFAERYDQEVLREDFAPFVGAGENRFIGGVASKYGIEWDQEPDKARTYEIYLEIIKGNLKPLGGVLAFVAKCQQMGLKLSVATSADRVKLEGNLKEIGLAESMFDTCLTGTDVENKKPDPEIFIKAVDAMGLTPGECVVVEDSPNGIKAAVAAGCRCLGLTTSFDEKTVMAAGASWVAPDLSDVPDAVFG